MQFDPTQQKFKADIVVIPIKSKHKEYFWS